MRTSLTGLALAGAVLLGGCGSNAYTPEAGSPPAAVFAAACAGCHGDAGGGKLFGLLKVAGSGAPEADLVAMIAEGGMLMPAFPNIPEPDRLALAQYLKGL
jgi:mono/diheme cytochrome c family protein